MKIRELAQHWEENAKGRLTDTGYRIHLDVEAAARLAAITEMYPKRQPEELLGELIGAALEELEKSFPYVKGSTVVATDEEGDPLYEESEHALEKNVKLGQIHEPCIFQPYVATAAFS